MRVLLGELEDGRGGENEMKDRKVGWMSVDKREPTGVMELIYPNKKITSSVRERTFKKMRSTWR
jgi:hypothetical protein